MSTHALPFAVTDQRQEALVVNAALRKRVALPVIIALVYGAEKLYVTCEHVSSRAEL